MSFTGFYWVLLGFTGFYWVLLGFTGFYWVLLGFLRVTEKVMGLGTSWTRFDLVKRKIHCFTIGFPRCHQYSSDFLGLTEF